MSWVRIPSPAPENVFVGRLDLGSTGRFASVGGSPGTQFALVEQSPPAAADKAGMTTVHRSLSLFLGALTLLACEHEPAYGNSPETAYRIEGTCTRQRPWCNDEFDSCMERGAQACNTCYQVGGLGCSSFCNYTADCQAQHCGRNEGCATWSFAAALGEQDPAILETCQAASNRDAACEGAPYPAGTCELAAATERTETTALYECVANHPCGGAVVCANFTPDAGLAQLVCDALDDCGSSWASCTDGSLAAWLGWLRHDVRDGVRQCAELPECNARPTCIQEWIRSLTTL